MSNKHIRILIIILGALSLLNLVNLLSRIDSLPAEVSFRIQCASAIAHGKVPYIDLLVCENPIVLAISFIPIKLAQFAGVEAGHMLATVTLIWEWLLATTSLAISAALILRRPIRRFSPQCYCFLLMFATLNLISTYQFGQPEHLLMLGIIPYTLGRWLEYGGSRLKWWETIATGCGAGVACCQDPYFVAVPIVLELFLASMRRRLPGKRVFGFGIAVVTILCVEGSVFVCAKSTMQTFLEFMWPVINAHRQFLDVHTYSRISTPDGRMYIYLLIVLTLIQFGNRKESRLSGSFTMLGWLGFMWYVAQSDGFTFQLLPLFWSTFLTLSLDGSSLWLEFSRLTKLTVQRKISVVLASFAIAILSALLVQENQHALAASAKSRLQKDKTVEDPAALLLRCTKPNDTVLVLTEDLRPLYPLITLADRKGDEMVMSTIALRESIVMQQNDYPSKKLALKINRFYLDALKKELEINPPAAIFLSSDSGPLVDAGILHCILDRYTLVSQARFYTDNVPPQEHSSFNYNMEMYRLKK